MLQELRIQNFAIIDSLTLDFANGFNVITGETGAGKSIIIDAVELLLGSRADTSTIRGGAERALVEGVFELTEAAEMILNPVMEREELSDDENPGQVVLTREIRRNGRNTARVNGVTVKLEVLGEIGSVLVDVHGQSEHLSLLKTRYHIDLLDRYGGLTDHREALGEVVIKLAALRKELNDLLQNEAALKRRAELLQAEADEIDAAMLNPGEDDDLVTERNRLSNSEQLATLTAQAVMLLTGDDDAGEQQSAVDQLQEVAVILGKLAQIDDSLDDDQELAESLSDQVAELAITLRDYAEEVEYNPDRLNEVEERLEVINNLKRRFGGSIESVLEHMENASKELETIGNRDAAIAKLRGEEEKLLRHIGELAERLTRERQRVGKDLARRIVTELADLRMQNTTFEVSITQRDDPDGAFVKDRRLAFDSTGTDNVEFLMSANPGEPLRPLVKVASGGEMARVMLALKRVLSQADQTPTLIFDEIDQGIGARVGTVVGEKLWMLSNNHQVLVVTHLAQLAGYADRHYRVTKETTQKRTTTHITQLDEVATRIEELAAMLGAVGESGQASARDILAEAASRKLNRAVEGSAPIEQAKLFDEGE